MAKNLPYFNAELEKRPFIAGDAFSMADITLFAALDFAEIVGLPVSSDLAALAAWRTKVRDIPAVKNRSGQETLPTDLARLSA